MMHAMRGYIMSLSMQCLYLLPIHVSLFRSYIGAYNIESGLKSILVKNWFCVCILTLSAIIKI